MEYLEVIKAIVYIVGLFYLSLAIINLNIALKVYIDKKNTVLAIITIILIAIISIAGILFSHNFFINLNIK